MLHLAHVERPADGGDTIVAACFSGKIVWAQLVLLGRT